MSSIRAAAIAQGLRRKISRNLKLIAALICSCFIRKSEDPTSQTWVFGAFGGEQYGDNSAALYEYIRRHHREIDAVWVMNPASPDWTLARQYGPVLNINSLATYIRCLRADVHVVSHGAFDIPTCSSNHSRAFKVRLGHGITAFKKAKGKFGRSISKANKMFQLVTVSSELEKTYKSEWGIPESAMVVTGLPRYDLLANNARSKSDDKSDWKSLNILYMPTWRDWLSAESVQVGDGDFQRNIRALVEDPQLSMLLEKHDGTLYMAQHVYGGYGNTILQGVAQERLALLDNSKKLHEAIRLCDVLITDYSSVAWDFLFQDKPVIFYHFDIDMYQKHRGAYVDLTAPLFGPVASSAPEVVQHLSRFLEQGQFNSETTRQKNCWRSGMFTYLDSNNAKRVTEQILTMVSREMRGTVN